VALAKAAGLAGEKPGMREKHGQPLVRLWHPLKTGRLMTDPRPLRRSRARMVFRQKAGRLSESRKAG